MSGSFGIKGGDHTSSAGVLMERWSAIALGSYSDYYKFFLNTDVLRENFCFYTFYLA